MLDLYRASAGSGKTYTLAKKYLWYFLTIKIENNKERLRTEAEIYDSAHHILAVTFTNKATNEMQMRIVGALFDLALLRRKRVMNPDGSVKVINPDYLDDFCHDLKVTEADISRVAKVGLSALLENYSDFKVSTIDSFFQQVLRTFAYESDLNDTYQIELDSEYLSQIGVDATLKEIDANSRDTSTPFWVRTLIDRTEKGKWNIFTRTTGSANSRSQNPYKDFISSVKRMENEQYKKIRHEIEEYFHKHTDELPKLYVDLQKKYETPVKDAFKRLQKATQSAYENLTDELKNTRAKIGKIALFYKKLLTTKNLNWDSPADQMPSFPEEMFSEKKWKEYEHAHSSEAEKAMKELGLVLAEFEKWENLSSGKAFRHWMLYKVNLPFYALYGIVTRKRQEYLEENNAVELGETSMILSGIIGDSDTPFIYERIGTRLNHFLIDEFQDTSAMQWKVLKPLLDESMSRGNGNLIIGDAKQSIYRFRNADPSLILEKVPSSYPDNINMQGMVPAENTNYRSELRVVQFNNSFFEYLVQQMDASTDAARMKFGPLYSNVVQRPNKTDKKGYVELHFAPMSKTAALESMVQELPLLIETLLDRGYKQREIAILVQTHDNGERVIQSFIDHNRQLADTGGHLIRFVSEESLKVASSRAVSIVTGVLRNLARGSKPEIRTKEERRKYGAGNWTELEANFKYFLATSEHKTIAECLDEYLESETKFDALSDLVNHLQSLAIPALTEAVAAAFLTDELRSEDAVYLAAFQDLVLEYCEGHPTDIGSFLKWWERKSKSASISSPENIDAVQVVTVHKSKGLQYECVIIPFADWDFNDPVNSPKLEWRWIEPELVEHDTLKMPPYIPVETSREMRLTNHADLLDEYYDQVKMDRLNAAYVAFTRAKKELYVFSSVSDLKGKSMSEIQGNGSMGSYLLEFLREDNTADRPCPRPGETDPRLDRKDITVDITNNVICIGSPDTEVGQDRKEPAKLIPIESYDSVKFPEFLKYRTDLGTGMADIAEDEDPEAEDLDIRQEGTIKHAVLESVTVPSDLPASIRHLRITGVIPDTLAPVIERDLEKALSRPEVAEWFDGSAKVLNERPLLRSGYVSKRPDRLLLYPDGNMTVIDYKFGEIPKDDRHKRQVRKYMQLLESTKNCRHVKGYLWYVNKNEIIPVEIN